MSAFDYLLKRDMELFRKTWRQENNSNPTIITRYFTPDSSYTWLASEYDPDTRMFFGYVCGQSREWGYFSLDELMSIRGKMGLRVERDLYFDPTPFSNIQL